MAKVFENTGRRIVAYSDDGSIKLIAIRRAFKTERFGRTAFAGSHWVADTYKRSGSEWEKVGLSAMTYNCDKKEDVIASLANVPQFSRAYKELTE